ncbi:Prostaglandin E2 receptor EP3 subtype [Fukomys damarensis]|uniref:Prostaglandin E2 receptor EP3 subtype n=1 Tax=Fukomys damarensis TaxID=885580 RepID=A0A091CZB9_FUKDA|nr:Prostaglandin E2 receptor EP3 subtype [Fukomys damarensis]
MMITGFVGNALAMLLVSRSYRRRESKRKKSFLLCIGWLALTDLVGQLLTSPVVIVVYLSQQRWEEHDPDPCHFCFMFFGFFGGVFFVLFCFVKMGSHCVSNWPQHRWAGTCHLPASASWSAGLLVCTTMLGLVPVLAATKYCLVAENSHVPSLWLSLISSCTCANRNMSVVAHLGCFQSLAIVNCAATDTSVHCYSVVCSTLSGTHPGEIMMLRMIFNQTSVEHCKTQTEKQKECHFFLIAVRLASLNQILDPWVYLLLRKILLRKFCQGKLCILYLGEHFRDEVHLQYSQFSVSVSDRKLGTRADVPSKVTEVGSVVMFHATGSVQGPFLLGSPDKRTISILDCSSCLTLAVGSQSSLWPTQHYIRVLHLSGRQHICISSPYTTPPIFRTRLQTRFSVRAASPAAGEEAAVPGLQVASQSLQPWYREREQDDHHSEKGCLSMEEAESMVQKAEKYKAEGEKQRDMVSSKSSLEPYAFNMKATVEGKKLQGKINDEDKTEDS